MRQLCGNLQSLDDLIHQDIFDVFYHRRFFVSRDDSGIGCHAQIGKPRILADRLYRSGKSFDGDGDAGDTAIFSDYAGPRTRGGAASSAAVAGYYGVDSILSELIGQCFDHFGLGGAVGIAELLVGDELHIGIALREHFLDYLERELAAEFVIG